MPPLPGEGRLLTLYADTHYYFAPPGPRPSHHRFDKACYVYLYRHASTGKGRLEIANFDATGATPAYLDAVHGSVDTVHLRNSPLFPTRCTIVVDAHPPPAMLGNSQTSLSSASSASAVFDPQEWQLPNADMRDEVLFQFRIHTLDLYFWKLEDAVQFVEAAKTILRPDQLDVEVPSTSPDIPSAHDEDMSPVVQQLENMAFKEHERTYEQAPAPNSSIPHSFSPAGGATALPPPPPGPPPLSTGQRVISPMQSPSPLRSTDSQNQSSLDLHATTTTDFTPLAYNPAAPAAPEPIKLREATPPPPDSSIGTGLVAAAISDQAQTVSSPPPIPEQQQSYTPHQQEYQYQQNAPLFYGSGSASLNRPAFAAPFSAPPTQTQFPGIPHSPPPQEQQYFAPPPTTNAKASAPTATATLPGTPTYQILGTPEQMPSYRPPLQHLQPQYTDYFAHINANAPQRSPYSPGADINGQVYYPTEVDQRRRRSLRHHHSESVAARPADDEERKGRFEHGLDRVDRGVGKLLRRLERKIG